MYPQKQSGLRHGWTEITTHALVSTITTYSRLLSSFINQHELLYSAYYACSSHTLNSLFPPPGGRIKDYNAHFKVHAHSKYLVHNTPSRWSSYKVKCFSDPVQFPHISLHAIITMKTILSSQVEVSHLTGWRWGVPGPLTAQRVPALQPLLGFHGWRSCGQTVEKRWSPHRSPPHPSSRTHLTIAGSGTRSGTHLPQETHSHTLTHASDGES